jgi:hypothetical protein
MQSQPSVGEGCNPFIKSTYAQVSEPSLGMLVTVTLEMFGGCLLQPADLKDGMCFILVLPTGRKSGTRKRSGNLVAVDL